MLMMKKLETSMKEVPDVPTKASFKDSILQKRRLISSQSSK